MIRSFINIEKFFIVSKVQLDSILLSLGLQLNDGEKFISYILINIFAYFVIIVLYKIIKMLLNMLFRRVNIFG